MSDDWEMKSKIENIFYEELTELKELRYEVDILKGQVDVLAQALGGWRSKEYQEFLDERKRVT